MKIERLGACDYDELITFLNKAFHYKREDGFEVLLPVMWRRDDAHMSKHLVIREGGKMRAAMGVYPLKVHCANESLLFATCGNIGTAEEYRGLGYMSVLMHAAMNEIKQMNVDAARLGGQRQRYERFGFAMAGTTITRQITPKNIERGRNAKWLCGEVSFHKLSRDDIEKINFVKSLHDRQPWYVERGNGTDFFDVMCAWRSVPYIAYHRANGVPVGALVVAVDGKSVLDQYAISSKWKYNILASWLAYSRLDAITYISSPWDHEFNCLADMDCENMCISGATQIKVLNWVKLANALMKMRQSIDTTQSHDKLIIEIEQDCRLCFRTDTCVLTDESPDLSLSQTDATRFLFGPGAPENVCDLPPKKVMLARSLFPLPMYWNGQDRV